MSPALALRVQFDVTKHADRSARSIQRVQIDCSFLLMALFSGEVDVAQLSRFVQKVWHGNFFRLERFVRAFHRRPYRSKALSYPDPSLETATTHLRILG